MIMNRTESLPKSETITKLDFESAELVLGEEPGTQFLVVTGQASCTNMQVSLDPLYYFDTPDYWGIEVVGRLPGGICLNKIKTFTEAILINGITGNKGIEVIGATMNLLIDVPPIG
jgi:hypothetical protein